MKSFFSDRKASLRFEAYYLTTSDVYEIVKIAAISRGSNQMHKPEHWISNLEKSLPDVNGVQKPRLSGDLLRNGF